MRFSCVFLLLLLFCACSDRQQEKRLSAAELGTLREQYPDSFLQLSRKLSASKTYKDLALSDLYSQTGHYYYDRAHYDSAYKYYENAYTLRKEAGDSEAMYNSLASMADVMAEKGETAKAISLYNTAIPRRKDMENLCDDHVNIAELYTRSGDSALADLHFRHSIAIASQLKDAGRQGRAWFNYALWQSSSRHYDSADYYLQRAATLQQYASDPGHYVNILIAKGHLAYDRKQYAKAIAWFDSALVLAEPAVMPHERLNTYAALAAAYEAQPDMVRANHYLKAQTVLSDSLFSDDIAKTIASMEVQYDTERKEKDNVLLKTSLSSTRLWLGLAASLILAVAVLLYARYLNGKNKQKLLQKENQVQAEKIDNLMKQSEISQHEKVMESLDEERGRIAAEIHDRLGGLLSMIKVHFSDMEHKIHDLNTQNLQASETFKTMINQAILEVREMSKDIGSSLVQKFGLSNALQDITDKVQSVTGIKVSLALHNAEQAVSHKQAIALYRVAQESLTNIIKHAEASEVQVSLTGLEQSMVLIIEDNGKGFDSSKMQGMGGLGLESMKKRMADAGGRLTLDSTKGRGTTVIAEVNF